MNPQSLIVITEFYIVFTRISKEVLQVPVDINLLPEVNYDCHWAIFHETDLLYNCLQRTPTLDLMEN
jgi:hypothetical protein